MDNLFFKEEHKMIQNMVCDFAKDEIRPIAKELDKNGSFPREIVKKMGELGLMGINVPAKYGGSELDTIAYSTAVIELAKVDASVAITMASHSSLGTLPLLLFGNERLKKKHLPKIASGEMLSALGLIEPHAGSDIGSIKTTATKVGEKYIINGEKIFITNAGEAGLLSFTSRIIEKGSDKGIGVFIVSTDMKGLRVGEKENKMGWRASDTRSVYFENMEVDSSSILYFSKNGINKFLKSLTLGRLSIGALSVGTARAAYQKAMEYSNDRIAFNKPINHFQSISFKLADMATKIEASELLVYHAAWLKDKGENFIKEAAMAKLYASEAAMEITREAIQIHGGYGYVHENDVERFFRDAKILEIVDGTSEIQRLTISREIIKDKMA
ncbi:MAG: acyl-CoA dehydrogenase [Candidatus Neomarinimicrobiota bacterium]|nr:MAG: acyl-CoA dehydrogenase [Candidatus Neomarinimicrobiota bacterium]